jgi:SAM-dependent methyltransferase
MPVHRYDSALGAQVYDLVHSFGPIGGPDVDGVWLPLARECGPPILELGCGTGRVLIPLARAGFEVTGLDSSAHMLAVAWRKLADETAEVRERVTLVKGDMGDFDLHRRFALIICPFNTFQLLLAREDQERALRCARRALRSGGRFALSVFNPRLDLLAGGQWQSKPVVRKEPASGRSLETYHRTLRWGWADARMHLLPAPDRAGQGSHPLRNAAAHALFLQVRAGTAAGEKRFHRTKVIWGLQGPAFSRRKPENDTRGQEDNEGKGRKPGLTRMEHGRYN